MKCQINHLANYPDMIPVLAQWHDKEWRHFNLDSYDLRARIADYQQVTGSKQLPIMLVAHDKGKPLGSVRLIENDMDTHQELSPWLASLYVHPDFRRQGIATRLIAEIETFTKQLGFNRLYLYTENMVHLYTKLGWQHHLRDTYFNKQVAIMMKDLFD